MNNETKYKITIKYRGDRVYDVYVGTSLFVSKGSVQSVLECVKDIMESNSNE